MGGGGGVILPPPTSKQTPKEPTQIRVKKVYPFVTKSSPDITVTGEWLKSEIDECLYRLQKAGFYVPVVISDDHTSNVRAFKVLLDNYHGYKNLFIYHPVYNETRKTYLFFDI